MSKSQSLLIANLVDDLQPVAALSTGRGAATIFASVAITLVTVAFAIGLRPALFNGSFDPIFLLSSGSFLMLGSAAAATVIGLSRPQVGNNHNGWVWAALMTALLPISAVIMSLFGNSAEIGAEFAEHGLACLATGTAFGTLTGASLTLWLRQGAPTSPTLAGLLTGVAAGSFGIFAVSMHCAYSEILHIGIWHSLVVVVSAGLGRLLVPLAIRW